MKKRRTIIAFLLIAALCLGVGYAGLARDLSITGKAKSTPHNLDVYFSAASIKEATVLGSEAEDTARKGTIETTSGVGTPGDITISLTASGMSKAGDKLTATYTITSDNEYDVTVAVPVITQAQGSAFKITTTWGTAAKTLTSDAPSVTFEVTVELLTPSADAINEDFTITFNASAGTQTASTT
ncbi:MAG: hypothetical protein IJY47_03420 [Clostridia bacterium]|nr:hypothetical protein [Clostridia bacterium]